MVDDSLPVVRLGDVLPNSYKNGIYKSSDFYGEGTPILRINDFDNNGLLINKELREVRLAKKEIDSYRLKYDDIVVNRVNSLTHIGKSHLWKDSSEKPVVYESNMMRIEADRSLVLPEYLIRILHSHKTRAHFRRVAKRAVAQCSVSQQDVKSLSFPLPPLAAQRRIARILSTWDEAILYKEQLLENSKQQKKALMQLLLTGKRRLPGFEEEWSELTLGQLFSERKEAGITGLSLLSVTSEHGIINRNDVGRKDTSSKDKSKYLKVCPGDIAYNTMRMWQGVSSLSSLEGIVSPAYTVLKPKDGVNSSFAAYLFKLPIMIHRFYRHSQGLVSDTWNLKYKHFSKIKVAIPETNEQRAIADILSKEDEAIRAIKIQIEQLRQEKRALMQQLLTGKRRVKVDDTE